MLDPTSALAGLEAICTRDVQRRNIGPLAAHVRGNLAEAAARIARHPAPHVGIITGFYLAQGVPPACESDGPPGAALLAAGLMAAGIACRIATDAASLPVVAATVGAATVGASGPSRQIAIDVADDCAPPALLAERWRALPAPITHVVALERCGPAEDGVARGADGAPVSTLNAAMEDLFTGGSWTRIAIGDLGNELGMGNLPAALMARWVRHGARIRCAVASDVPIIAGISNLGAAALLAAIAVLRPEAAHAVLPVLDPATAEALLRAAVFLGGAVALDAATGYPRPWLAVDAIPWEQQSVIYREIRAVLAAATPCPPASPAA